VDERNPQARSGRSRRQRGQTNLDFAVGTSVFLLSLVAVFVFVPGMIGPFTGGGQEHTVTANNVADRLSQGSLGDPETPHVLDTECAVDFFDGVANDDCGYDGSTLQERVGIRDRQNVNVTLRGNVTGGAGDGSNDLCWDAGTESLVEADDGGTGSCSVRLSVGGTPPSGAGTSVTARRIVSIEGTDATMIVEVW